MVPNGWLLKSLNELTNEKLAYGANAAACDFHENGFRYIRITDIDDQGNLNENVVGIEESAGALHHLEDNDFLFARSGNTVGKTFLFEEAIHPKSAYAGYLIRYRPDPSKLTPHYLKQFCFSGKYENWVKSQIRAGAQPNINAKEYGSMEIPLPPIPEQQKIAKILSTWDKAISMTERLIENSTQQKKALMQQLLTSKKRLLDESGKRFEGEWDNVLLGDISHITTGSSNREDSSLVGEYAFFDRSIDVRTSGIFLFDAEAVIVGGEGQDFVPKYFEGKFDLHQRTYAIMDFKNADGKFLFYYIGYYRHYFLSQAVGSTVKSLRLPMFQKMPIKLPSVKEQQKIATVLTNADKEIELLEQQLADLQQEKKALMQVLLTGKKRVVVDE